MRWKDFRGATDVHKQNVLKHAGAQDDVNKERERPRLSDQSHRLHLPINFLRAAASFQIDDDTATGVGGTLSTLGFHLIQMFNRVQTLTAPPHRTVWGPFPGTNHAG